MREIDKDGTGNINYREFVRFLEKPAASKPTTTASKPAMVVSDRVASELRTKFDAAISSGKIKSYEDVFKAMDRDGNGTVSRREFEDGMADLRVRTGCSWRTLLPGAVVGGDAVLFCFSCCCACVCCIVGHVIV